MIRSIEYRAAREQAELPCAAYDRWPDRNGNDALQFCRLPTGFYLRFPNRADFEIQISTGSVICCPAPSASHETVTALYLNQVVPLLHNHAGKLVLHAAAIDVSGRAIALAGATGRGKSTLAAAFASRGWPFLTDDSLVLDAKDGRYDARPSHAAVRLWQDSEARIFNRPDAVRQRHTEKSRLVSGSHLPHRNKILPLGAIYFLGDGASPVVTITSLSPREGLSALINHAFVLDVDDRARMRAHFGRLATLAETVPIFALDHPRQYEQLGLLTRTIMTHAQGTCTS